MALINKPAIDLLYEYLAAANPTDINRDHLVFGAPTPITDRGDGNNTVVVITPTSESGMSGRRPIHYRRLDLEIIFQPPFDHVYFTEKSLTSWDVVQKLNQMYNLHIDMEDVIVEPIDFDGNSTTYTLAAAAGSYGYVGSCVLKIGETMNDLLPDNILDGFEYAEYTPGDNIGVEYVSDSSENIDADVPPEEYVETPPPYDVDVN